MQRATKSVWQAEHVLAIRLLERLLPLQLVLLLKIRLGTVNIEEHDDVEVELARHIKYSAPHIDKIQRLQHLLVHKFLR